MQVGLIRDLRTGGLGGHVEFDGVHEAELNGRTMNRLLVSALFKVWINFILKVIKIINGMITTKSE